MKVTVVTKGTLVDRAHEVARVAEAALADAADLRDAQNDAWASIASDVFSALKGGLIDAATAEEALTVAFQATEALEGGGVEDGVGGESVRDALHTGLRVNESGIMMGGGTGVNGIDPIKTGAAIERGVALTRETVARTTAESERFLQDVLRISELVGGAATAAESGDAVASGILSTAATVGERANRIMKYNGDRADYVGKLSMSLFGGGEVITMLVPRSELGSLPLDAREEVIMI